MRRLLHDDVVAAGRLLLSIDEGARRDLLCTIIRRAHWADKYRKRIGRAHPVWGNGSLGDAARLALPQSLPQSLPPECRLNNRDFAGCMALVFETLAGMPSASAA
ncbi:DUF7742 family protein [Brevirhabdus sp.]|uniref:DUF7742 family protein n=1 Tax=Brevirhabdus sp. TaxID=2004514 RepID=UPI004058EA21